MDFSLSSIVYAFVSYFYLASLAIAIFGFSDHIVSDNSKYIKDNIGLRLCGHFDELNFIINSVDNIIDLHPFENLIYDYKASIKEMVSIQKNSIIIIIVNSILLLCVTTLSIEIMIDAIRNLFKHGGWNIFFIGFISVLISYFLTIVFYRYYWINFIYIVKMEHDGSINELSKRIINKKEYLNYINQRT